MVGLGDGGGAGCGGLRGREDWSVFVADDSDSYTDHLSRAPKLIYRLGNGR